MLLKRKNIIINIAIAFSVIIVLYILLPYFRNKQLMNAERHNNLQRTHVLELILEFAARAENHGSDVQDILSKNPNIEWLAAKVYNVPQQSISKQIRIEYLENGKEIIVEEIFFTKKSKGVSRLRISFPGYHVENIMSDTSP